jgi:NarL family two-component system response regulator LiaR
VSVATDASGQESAAPAGRPVRVFVCDDHDIVRRGLRSYLETEPDLEVVGEAASGEAAVANAPGLAPDVVLMDLVMPGIGGVEATRRLLEAAPTTRVVVLTSVVTDELVVPALEAGALSYVLKSSSAQEVARAIRAAAAGDATLDPRVAASVVRAVRQPALRREATAPFTAREREVLLEVARGLSNQEIADALGIGVKTVKTHVSSLLSKLGLYDRTQLAVWAHTHGVVREAAGETGPQTAPGGRR